MSASLRDRALQAANDITRAWSEADRTAVLEALGLIDTPIVEHTVGSLESYRAGCRCQACTTIATATAKQARDRMRARARANPSLIPHGTRTGYNTWGCRCDACQDAQSRYGGHRRRPPGPVQLQPCGTYAAYQRHDLEGKKTCEPCRKARRAYRDEYKARMTAARSIELIPSAGAA